MAINFSTLANLGSAFAPKPSTLSKIFSSVVKVGSAVASVAQIAAGIGAITSGVGSVVAGNTSKDASEAAAGNLDEAARLTRLNAHIQGLQRNRQLFVLFGGQRADTASNGLTDSGSAMDIIRATAQQGGMESILQGTQDSIEYENLVNQSASVTAAGKSDRTSGRITGAASILGGLANIAGGFK